MSLILSTNSAWYAKSRVLGLQTQAWSAPLPDGLLSPSSLLPSPCRPAFALSASFRCKVRLHSSQTAADMSCASCWLLAPVFLASTMQQLLNICQKPTASAMGVKTCQHVLQHLAWNQPSMRNEAMSTAVQELQSGMARKGTAFQQL